MPHQYEDAMNIELLDLKEIRVDVLDRIEVQMHRIERCWNNKVEPKSFKEGDLVWKVILVEGKMDHFHRKWVLKHQVVMQE